MSIFKKMLFYLKVGYHPFDSDIWKRFPKHRKLFVKDILENEIALGMTKEQLVSSFGNDKREYIDNVWAYPISTYRNGEIKEMLCFCFDENNIVSYIKFKYRKRF
jgi:hypothetical protein